LREEGKKGGKKVSFVAFSATDTIYKFIAQVIAFS
jgi:hypothetical protein